MYMYAHVDVARVDEYVYDIGHAPCPCICLMTMHVKNQM